MQPIEEVEFINQNGISLDMVSHDELYDDLVKSGLKPVVVNDFKDEFSDRKVGEALNALIRTHYGTDELDTIPRCDFGCTTGGYNRGITCPCCGTTVERIVDKPFVSDIWIRPPEGIPAFINPRFWNMMEVYFKSNKFSLIEYLTCRSYVPGGRGDANASNDKTVIAIKNALDAAGIERGIEFFYNNFDMIMGEILQPKPYLLTKSGKASSKNGRIDLCEDLRLFVMEYRNCVFSHMLPFPSKLIMVSEEGGGVGYIDKNMPAAFDALKTIVQIERPTIPISERTVETKTIKANRVMAEYYRNFRKNVYGKKPGMARRQQGSTRSPMSGRAVIAPKANAHKYDELSTPWAWTISLCRIMIANKLLKMRYTPQEIFLFTDKCIVNSEGEDGDVMEGIFDTLIDESPSGGIEVAMLRNPTLERLSDQIYRIVEVMRDTNVNAIMMSVLTIKGPNADYDGDQLQVKLLVDAIEREQFSRLASHLGIMDTDHPLKVSGVITLHPECISMANNFLDKHRVGLERSDDELVEVGYEIVIEEM